MPDGTPDPSQLISTVGYSSLAIVISMIIMVLMLLGILALSLVVAYPTTMPLAANCSASLAAITQPSHGSEFEAGLAREKLSWGVVLNDPNVGSSIAASGHNTKHATFSADPVSSLVEGDIYT